MVGTQQRADGAQNIVRRLWQYCNILRDDGLSYPDYVEQLTYLLFLKMADEQREMVPKRALVGVLASLDAVEMHAHYTRILPALGELGGMLGLIFGNAKTRYAIPQNWCSSSLI
jgi:type I restriction enzyme M protein